jgi:RHS repeat-associated protein
VLAQRLVLEWVPGDERGLSELALWGAYNPVSLPPELNWADRLTPEGFPGALTFASLRNSVSVGEIGRGDEQFDLAILAEPRSFSRAFLVYELSGVAHFRGVPRAINDYALRPGGDPTRVAADAEAALQIEEIDPAWLVRGNNRVRFAPPRSSVAQGAVSSYRIQQLRIVAIPHGAAYAAVPPSAFPDRRENMPKSSSKWLADFGEVAAPHAIGFRLTESTHGELVVTAGSRQRISVPLRGLAPGWHQWDATHAFSATETLRFTATGAAREPGVIGDLRASGGPAARAPRPELRIAYPLHGECQDGRAFIRGFVRLAGRNLVQLKVAGRVLGAHEFGSEGGFEASVDEPAGSKPWSARLEATLGDGSRLTRTVALAPCDRGHSLTNGLVADEAAPYAEWVTPEQGKTLHYAGATLEIPKGALVEPTRITIRPLSREQASPADSGLVNVSPGNGSYRFGPAGLRFKKAVRLLLPYDRGALPPAATTRHIATLYYDTPVGQWRAIPKVTEAADGVLVSETDHFTEFMNATIPAPDAPGPKNYGPAEMQGIQLGSPSAGVDLIAPPSANPRRTAELRYPLRLPPGRNGLAPQLALSYSSARGNGWLGIGWDLALSSIEHDTRFGVPDYGGEQIQNDFPGALAGAVRYQLDGAQLTAAGTAAGGTRYSRRVEGGFERILKLPVMAEPAIQYWEVTDKLGTKSVFGRSPNARLADVNAPTRIFKWALERVEDRFGNLMLFKYEHDQQAMSGVSMPQIYPKKICYGAIELDTPTDCQGTYNVLFQLDASNTRPDRIIDARAGFPVKTARRLDKVEVLHEDNSIRSYALRYEEGAFRKSLLKSVGMEGSDGRELYSHDFDYKGADMTAPFASAREWGVMKTSSGVRTERGLSHTKGFSAGGGGGLGVDFVVVSASVSGGGMTGENRILVSPSEITGDGLLDFLKNTGEGSLNFAPREQSAAFDHLLFESIPGVSRSSLGFTSSGGWTAGGSVSILGGVAGLGGNIAHTESEDTHVLSDLNGDGFVDQVSVSDGRVKYRPGFKDGFSAEIDFGAYDESAIVFANQDRLSNQQSTHFLVDPLARWKAPFAGTVRIGGTLQKRAAGGDGVRVSISKNAAQLWSHDVAADDLNVCAPSVADACNTGVPIDVPVAAGDDLYFRVSSIDDTRKDLVAWSPEVAYQGVPAGRVDDREVYGSFVYKSSFSDDFRLVGLPKRPWIPNAPGVVEVLIQGIKDTTSDDVVLNLYSAPPGATAANVTLELSLPLSAAFTGPYAASKSNIRVGSDDVLFFEIKSDSPIDPARVGFDPIVRYTRYSRPDPVTNSFVEGDVLGCAPDASGTIICAIENDPTPDSPVLLAFIEQRPEVNHDIFMWQATVPTLPEVGGGAVDAGTFSKVLSSESVCALIQGVNRLFSKACLGPNQTGPVTLPPVSGVNAGEPIYFTLISKAPISLSGTPGTTIVGWNPTLAGSSPAINVRALDPNFGDTTSPSPTHDMMAGGYHRWSFGDYRADRSFDEGALLAQAVTNDTSSFLFASMTRAGFRDSNGPAYKTRGQGTFIAAGSFSPGRTKGGRGFSEGGGFEALRLSDTWSYGLNANLFGIDAGIGAADTTGEVELLDMNGDRFPDLVTRNGVLFNTGVAGFTSKRTGQDFDEFRLINQKSMRLKASVSLGGDDEKNQAVPDTDTKGRTRAMMSTSFSVGLDYAVSSANTELLDVNQDGLPDRVEFNPDDETMRVRLNTGYALTAPIAWENPASRFTGFGLGEDILDTVSSILPDQPTGPYSHRFEDTGSLSAGVAVGGSVSVGIFGGGGHVGAGYVTSMNRKATEFLDLNKDGLLDHVTRKPGDPFLLVRLNLGDRFDQETEWPLPAWESDVEDAINGLGAEILARVSDISGTSSGTNETLGFTHSRDYSATFDAKVCVFFVCASAYGFYNDTAGGSEVGWTDVDGDGLLDQIAKVDGDERLHVKLNQLGQANLLEAVRRPFGGRIELDYERFGNEVGDGEAPAVDLPGNDYALVAMRTTDGRGQTLSQSFSYAEPLASGGEQQTGKFDRIERDDYGSAIVISTRGVPGSTGDGSQLSIRYENQDFYRRGLAQASFERDSAGNVFTRQTFRYEDPTALGVSVQDKPLPLVGSFLPAEVSRTTEWFEGQASVGKSTTETRTWHFDHGGLATLTMTADDGGADDLFYSVDYDVRGLDFASSEELFLARPSRVTARQGDGSGVVLRERRAAYAADTGALETYTTLISGGKIPGSSADYVAVPATTVLTRDSFGNIETITDANGYELAYGYDPTGIYQTSTTDSFGYSSTSEPNYAFGGVDTATDLNGYGTKYEYDSFGRLVAVWGPNDFVEDPIELANIAPTLQASYGLQPGVGAGPYFASMGHKDTVRNAAGVPQASHDYVETITFIDGFDRVIQTKKDLEKDFGDHTTIGYTVSGLVTFDERGRIKSQGQPIFSTAPATTLVDTLAEDPGAAERSTAWSYDILGRVTKLTTPADSEDVGLSFIETTTSYDFAPDQHGVQRFRTIVTDSGGDETVQRFDVMEQLVELVERANGNGGPPITTQYRYDAVGDLLEIEDTQGHVTSAAYDSVGRVVSLNSPDAGLTQWSYDLVGNVREQQTARLRALGQHISYEYDFNRLRQITYPSSASRVFVYGAFDQAGAGNGNRAGRVATELSEAGERSFRYDRQGNVVELDATFTRLRQTNLAPYRYQIQREYDSFGRLLKIRYPDLRAESSAEIMALGDENREAVAYDYDAGGSLRSIMGLNTRVSDHHPDESPNTLYLAHLGYDEFGQRVRQISGNFIETRYDYKQRSRRLSNVSADHRDEFQRKKNEPARPFQRLDYTYDDAGNITEFRNDAPFVEHMNSSVLIGNLQHSYQYDSLDRLTRASGAVQVGPNWRNRYTQEFVYDDIHNITKKVNQSFRQVPDGHGGFRDDNVVHAQTYDSNYFYEGARPHAVTRTEEQLPAPAMPFFRDYEYDESGNQTLASFHSDRREIVWNEEDLVSEVRNHGQILSKNLYDAHGQRTVSDHFVVGQEETAYLSPDLTIRDARYLTKHVYAGETQLASKLDPQWINFPPTLYFHPDHLGTTQYSSDEAQNLTQHDEYFPSGEVWQDETDGRYERARRFVWSGKELDRGSELYYFGARYYDPRRSQWLSPDPALRSYVTTDAGGGLKNPLNLALYTYAWNNPVKLIDKQGLLPDVPGSEADQSTYLKLSLMPLPLLRLIIASPTLRPRTVEAAARSGSLTNFGSHPGSTFLGTVGEALVMHNIENQSGGLFSGVSTTVVPQPAGALLPPGVGAAIGATMPDLLVTQVGFTGRFLGFRYEQRVVWNNTIGPGTGGAPTRIDHGAKTVVSLMEVTVSGSFSDIESRALKVAGWARAAPGVKAVLALDRGAFYSLSAAERSSVVSTVTSAGGYISLFRDLKSTSIHNARAAAAEIAAP